MHEAEARDLDRDMPESGQVRGRSAISNEDPGGLLHQLDEGFSRRDARNAIDRALLDPDESGDGSRSRPAHRDFGAVPGVVGSMRASQLPASGSGKSGINPVLTRSGSRQRYAVTGPVRRGFRDHTVVAQDGPAFSGECVGERGFAAASGAGE